MKAQDQKITIIDKGLPVVCYPAQVAADKLGCNVTALLKKIRERKMPSIKISRSVFVPASYVDEITVDRLPVYCRKKYKGMLDNPKKFRDLFATSADKDFAWSFIVTRTVGVKKTKKYRIIAVAVSRMEVFLKHFNTDFAILTEETEEGESVNVVRTIRWHKK